MACGVAAAARNQRLLPVSAPVLALALRSDPVSRASRGTAISRAPTCGTWLDACGARGWGAGMVLARSSSCSPPDQEPRRLLAGSPAQSSSARIAVGRRCRLGALVPRPERARGGDRAIAAALASYPVRVSAIPVVGDLVYGLNPEGSGVSTAMPTRPSPASASRTGRAFSASTSTRRGA